MTVRFLKAWNGNSEGQIVSALSTQEEDRLIALGFATRDLYGTGGFPVLSGAIKSVLSDAQKLNPNIKGVAGVGGGKLYDEMGAEITTGGDGIIYDTIPLSADFESVRGGPTISAGFDVVASASGNITIYDSLTNTGTIAFTGSVVANVPFSFVTPRKFVNGLSFKLNSGTATIALRAV